MAGHGMPSEAYDAPHLYNPDAMDFTTSMDETFEDGVTEQGMPQLFHLNYPLPSQHQSSHLAFSSAEAGFFNPPQQPLPPSFLQRQSSGLESESSSRFETPLLGGMPLLVHHQSWPGAHSVHSSKPIPVPYLDTNFDLTPPDMGDFDVLGGDMNSFGVGKSLFLFTMLACHSSSETIPCRLFLPGHSGFRHCLLAKHECGRACAYARVKPCF